MPYADAGSIRMYYEEYGDGVPLVLISGTGATGEHWKLEQVPAFAPHYRTIVFDHRGVGRSDRPEPPYSTRGFAADLADLLRVIGIQEPVHVLGHSMGGRVAQWAALDHPELVRSLVLAASGPGPIDDRGYFPGISPKSAARIFEHGWPDYLEWHLRSSDLFYRPTPELVERFVAANRGQFGTDLLSYLGHLDARQRHHTTDQLDRITMPVLAIVGTEDNYGSPGHLDTTRFFAKTLSSVEYVEIPDAAHCLHLETAAAFNSAVLDFLGRH